MAKQKVLVVEDDPNTCDLVRLQLEGAGYDVVCAFGGRDALNSARDERPDIILLDIVLPELDGLEVCREVRRFSNTPIMMVSGRDEEFDRVLGLELGADDYVTKPFSTRELVARVRAVLRRSNDVSKPEDQQVVNLP